jgi:hypothetical protein
MKALSDSDQITPGDRKEHEFEQDEAPDGAFLDQSRPAFIVHQTALTRWETRATALGGDVEPDSQDDDDPGHHILDVELQANEQQTVLDEAQDQDADHRLEDRAGPAEQRCAAENDRGQNLEFQPLPHGVLASQAPAGLDKSGRGNAKGGKQVGQVNTTLARGMPEKVAATPLPPTA